MPRYGTEIKFSNGALTAAAQRIDGQIGEREGQKIELLMSICDVSCGYVCMEKSLIFCQQKGEFLIIFHFNWFFDSPQGKMYEYIR